MTASNGAVVASKAVSSGEKTTRAHWDQCQGALPSSRFWSPFDPEFTDTCRLLRNHVRPGSRHLEIGFAPGKYLAYAAVKLRAKVAGIDYCSSGVHLAHRLFRNLGASGDLRDEDVFSTSFEPDSFSTVFSKGLIEHFDDPRPLVARHLELCRPGGTAIILIPNYGGIYGRAQRRLHPENLAIHNLAIMSPAALRDLFDPEAADVETFHLGRPALAGLTLPRRIQCIGGLMGSALPFQVPGLTTLIAAVARKRVR
jgi:2-polyprenyl-3-methyl-5-hydroxy-6-metoxy-1,4-benzoquinol methylase